MVSYIHKEFLKILDEVDWMDENTREKAKAKAEAITSYIGYPDELLDNTKITELYQNVYNEIFSLNDNLNLFSNSLNLNL